MKFYNSILSNRYFGGSMLLFIITLFNATVWAQENAQPRGMTAEEYKIARGVTIEDLDHDTYIKLADGKYVLDRYDMKPPYFITGDSGVKKRIDLYKLVERASMSELGMIVFFTNAEAGETFNLVIPNMATAGEVWNLYFDDMHQHDREEKDVALKMSYILSKEVAYLMQKSSGTDMSAMDQSDSGYDFCFPSQAMVTMGDGSQKKIADLVPGDVVAAYQANKLITTKVESISVHKKSKINLSKVILIPEETLTAALSTGENYASPMVELIATPNHPIMTEAGRKTMQALTAEDVVYRHHPKTKALEKYKVGVTTQHFDTTSIVYNLTTEAGNYLIDNIVVLGK